MTSLHQPASTNSAEPNTGNSSSQSCEAKCVLDSVKVVEEMLSEEPVTEEIHIESTNPSSSENTNKEDDFQLEVDQDAADEFDGDFGNIAVKNSSDVHFGNNTFYRYPGPVTISQVVYEDENGDRELAVENGVDNFGFQSETDIHTNEEKETRNDNRDDQKVVNKNEENKTKSVKGYHWLNIVYQKRKLLSICLLVALTIILIFLIILLVNNKSKSKFFPPQWYEESNLNGTLKIILRDDWLAESPNDIIDPLTLPVPNVIILCTSTDNCTNRAECTERVIFVQGFQMKTSGYADIAYNFLVGGDGYVYEGRGWHGKGAHAHIWNKKSIGIGFIGYFEHVNATEQQIIAAQMLIEEGVKNGYITKDYKLYAHRQVSNFPESPGAVLYENMKTWPHWTNKSFVPI